MQRYLWLLSGALAVAACAEPTLSTVPDDLTSVEGVEHAIDFDAFVDVAHGASDDVAKAAIHRQLKSALGALREQGIGVADRDAQRNLASMTLDRARKTVAGGGTVDRVRFHYRDVALVQRGPGVGASPRLIDLTLLFGDYRAHAELLQPACVDEPTDADSLWYHYAPRRAACRAAITAEQNAIDLERGELADPEAQIGAIDAARKFLQTRASLTPTLAAPLAFPEHDQLWGFAGDPARTTLVAYAFFGVDADHDSPRDLGLVEYLRFQRTLRGALPELAVSATEPHAWLLDFWVDGRRLDGITFADVERWVVDRTGFPVEVGTSTNRRADLLRQVIANFRDRWIVWSMPVRATRGGATRDMTVEVRTWFGEEDGSAEIRQRARWRYLEAFWHADVFAYTGHSHFGHGPLEPWTYGTGNFPDRYQTMLINSCLSFNYYDEDFLNMHPGGAGKLDVVVNALPAYWYGMGEATARYVAGVVSGTASWRAVLQQMAVYTPWQTGYDPMRAVNGEVGNTFDPAAGAIAIRSR